MICTTLQYKDSKEILQALEACEMAEIRLDRCSLSQKEIDECFSSDVPLIATCRIEELMKNEPALQDESLSHQSREIKACQIAEKRLCRAIVAGARYVDVEIEAPKVMSKRVRNVAHENGTVFIRSFHDFEKTDAEDNLRAAIVKCHYHGADMVKIVTMAQNKEDVQRVMGLYEWCRGLNDSLAELADGGLVAFCMGEAGVRSRIDCLAYGAPFTYAAMSEAEAAAPGQIPFEKMKQEIYGDFRFCSSADEEIYMPASKSFTQRAIIAAALAEGESHLKGYTPCGDNESAVEVAKSLGAEVRFEENTLSINGINASLESLNIERVDVGESGLLTRMLIPVMAQIGKSRVDFVGEKTLLNRPLTGAREIMEAFGARLGSLCGAADKAGSEDAVKVPLAVEGKLAGGRVDISGKHGSQLISGLLMALPFSDRNTTLVVSEPKSIPYMFITLEVLKKFGIKTGNEMLGGREFLESDGDWSLCSEIVFKVKGNQKYKAAEIDLERDWSAAANFLVAGAVFGKVKLQGLDTTSLQADLSIMDILMDAGASLSQTDGPLGEIAVQRAPLKSFNVDLSNCPDLFPITSVLAAFCQGKSVLSGVRRLYNKESDRASAIKNMLLKMGVKVKICNDDMIIEGHTLSERFLNKEIGLLRGGDYPSYSDHRMAMALKVAGLGADSPVVIDDEDCVSKSFPDFISEFDKIFKI